MIHVKHGDCLVVMPTLGPVDAIVTDPPYYLTAGKRGGSGPASLNVHNPAGRSRITTGFMGKSWDGDGIALQPETWALALALLPPGGYLVAFGGTRTHHRMWCAIEDAGFEIRDTLSWMYGSGFPKSRALLKPAWEPICLARKPGPLRHLAIDACRIPGENPSVERRELAARSGRFGRIGDKTNSEHGKFRANGDRDEGLRAYLADKDGERLGRWPANVVHDGSEEVLDAFARFGERTSGVPTAGRSETTANVYGQFAERSLVGGGDSGSAARFFFSAKADADDRCDSRHPTVKPVVLLRWLCRLVTPPGGTVLDPFAGSGTTGVACVREGFNAVLIEREAEYVADIRRRVDRLSGADTPLFKGTAA